MKQRYIVAGAWGRLNGDAKQAEVKATLTSLLADSEDDAVSQARAISAGKPDMVGWTLDSWSVRTLVSLI
jgi:hypothetical protein